MDSNLKVKPHSKTEVSYELIENFGAEPKGRLIHGENLAVMQQMSHQYHGAFTLIYIDPPFNVGSDFYSHKKVGDKLTKSHAFSDRWNDGLAGYLEMMRHRLQLIHDLLGENGSLYLHCDYRTTAHLRILLDQIFGVENYLNECIWMYKTGGMPQKTGFGRKHDTIHLVAKNLKKVIWNQIREKSYLSHQYGFKNITIHQDQKGPYTLVGPRDVWDIPALRGNQPERVAYPTQKPEALLQKMILASSNPGDLVGDFFCGSGTTGVVSAKLGRKWLMVDQGELAIKYSSERLRSLGSSGGAHSLVRFG